MSKNTSDGVRPPEPTGEADFTFATDRPFELTGGGVLGPVTLHYAWYGEMSPARDNVLLVCHALSGSARVADWWPQLFGSGKPFDLDRFCVLGVNMIGSCYGSTGPRSVSPATGRPYGGDFPVVSVLDVVRSQALLLDHLGVDRPYAVLGGSIGGLQALNWATEYPERVPRCVGIGAAPLSALALALSHIQRESIRLDPAWQGGHYHASAPPRHGLGLARALAMCTYKSGHLLHQRHGRKPDRGGEHPALSSHGRFDVAGYLDYQGRIFNDRFDANSYLVITRAMDTFDLGSTPEAEFELLRRIQARVLLVGISSDWLFPPEDVRSLCERMQTAGVTARYAELESDHGHDAFLADADDLAPVLMAELNDPEWPAGGVQAERTPAGSSGW
jgi:homoserine O-acetyltransferase